eukprot:1094718-Rhodomonas_salina.1
MSGTDIANAAVRYWHSVWWYLLQIPYDFVMDPCHTCMIVKLKQAPRPGKTQQRAPYPNYRWFTHLTGKMRVLSWTGMQYAAMMRCAV